MCTNLEDIPIIIEGILNKEEKSIIMDKLEKLTNDDLFMTELEAQKWDEWERKSIYNDGMIEGSEQSTIYIIKSMLKKKCHMKILVISLINL